MSLQVKRLRLATLGAGTDDDMTPGDIGLVINTHLHS
jgi:hypothetical protein